MAATDLNVHQARIGLAGAVSTLLGLVLGGSVFVLPGVLAAKAGPGVILSMAIASVVAIFSCVVTAQLASVSASNAGTTQIIERTLGMRWGFYAGWIMLAAAAMAISLLAYGCAGFVGVWLPQVNKHAVAVATIVAVALVNLMGVRVGVKFQIYFVVFKVAVLAAFCVWGLFHVDTALYVPFFPQGVAASVLAAIPAFYAYVGFSVLLEIGGEIRRPKRNIPLALGAGFLVLLVLYCLVPAVLVGVMPWSEYKDLDQPLIGAARHFAPAWFVQLIVAAGVVSCVATINSVLIAYPRTMVYLASAGYLPRSLARPAGEGAAPAGAVLLFALVSMLGTTLGEQLDRYAIFIVGGMMLTNILLALAALRLPTVMAAAFAAAEIRLGPLTRYFFALGLILLSAAMLAVGLAGDVRVALYFGATILAGVVIDLRQGGRRLAAASGP